MGLDYVRIPSTYILWRENMSVSNCHSDGSKNYLHDTTHYKSLCCSSKLVLNFNLCGEENSFLLI